MKLYFMLPLEVPKNQKLTLFILMHLQSNILNMNIILVVLVAWNILCLMPENMLQNSQLHRELNIIYSVNHLVVWKGSSFLIKL